MRTLSATGTTRAPSFARLPDDREATMTTKQLIDILSQFDPHAPVMAAFPSGQNHLERFDTEVIHVEELACYDGFRPLISVSNAHLLED